MRAWTERELFALAEEVLTDTQFRRLHLRHWEGFTVAQIAALEQVSRQAVNESLSGSIRMLKRARDERERDAA